MGKKSLSAIFLLLWVILALGCSSARKAQIRQEKIDRIISTARSYKGVPYRYGGVTRSGMDCSGLVINAFRSADIELPRTTRDQRKVGKKIKDIDDLEPGDLVFFSAKKRKRKITHVGIVTEVRGHNVVRFIHASTSLGVVESNLKTDYYTGVYRKGRRVF